MGSDPSILSSQLQPRGIISRCGYSGVRRHQYSQAVTSRVAQHWQSIYPGLTQALPVRIRSHRSGRRWSHPHGVMLRSWKESLKVCRESKLFLLVHRSNCGLGVSLATVDLIAAPAVQECTGCISDQHGKIFTNDRTKVTVRRSPAKAERRDVQGTCLCVSIPAAIVPFPFYTRTEHSPEQASTCIRRQPQSRDACMWQGELERQ